MVGRGRRVTGTVLVVSSTITTGTVGTTVGGLVFISGLGSLAMGLGLTSGWGACLAVGVPILPGRGPSKDGSAPGLRAELGIFTTVIGTWGIGGRTVRGLSFFSALAGAGIG